MNSPQSTYLHLYAVATTLREIRKRSELQPASILTIDNIIQLYNEAKVQHQSIQSAHSPSKKNLPTPNKSETGSAIENKDFRKYPVLPSLEEIKSKNIKFPLKEMRLLNSYESTYEYLHTLYGVLREDFVSAFRAGFADYLSSETNNCSSNINTFRKIRFQNIRIYQ